MLMQVSGQSHRDGVGEFLEIFHTILFYQTMFLL